MDHLGIARRRQAVPASRRQGTVGVAGRAGSDTMRAVKAFQETVGMEPADGYAGTKPLARLRQGL
jgi:peptidoglycan hydrolase-like protein with peptidoglycan-binding domain